MSLKEKLKEITSAERVLDSSDVLESYAQDESFMPRVRPRCIVKPLNMEEVQKIVMAANETGTPLVPISSGPPHFKGDTIPSVGGAVIVDLCEMKQIVRIDAKNKVAMIEPGVTFGQLKEALEKEGLAPYLPLVPNSSKSALTSYLEREPITIPRDHWETQDPLLCTEVIYGSGDLFRTGSAAGPGTPEEQWEVGRAMVRGYGPTQTDFTKLTMAAQGTMGIITWATVKCRRAPKFIKAFLVPSEDLASIQDLAYKVMWRRIGNQLLILNNHNLAALLADNAEGIKRLKAQLPSWILFMTIEGTGVRPEERVAWQEQALMGDAQKFGLNPTTTLGGIDGNEMAALLSGASPEPYWKTKYKGGSHDIFFMTTLDQTWRYIEKLNFLAGAYSVPSTDIGVYLQPTIQGTNCHCEFNVPYEPQNAVESDRIRALDQEASQNFANLGAFFSRPYGTWSRVAYGRDPATVAALRKVKNIFDPKGIMNPGKLCL